MSLFWKIMLIIAIVLVAIVITLYIIGKKAEKKKKSQDAQIAAAAQTVTMLIIDKKRMRLKDSGLPQSVIDQTPKYLRRTKAPIVKAKIGPKITSLICEESIFETIPVKKEVKAVVSGLYITAVKGLHGNTTEAPSKKVSWLNRMRKKAGI